MSGQKLVLDANVLYGNLSRDLLISLFAEGFYEAKWTGKRLPADARTIQEATDVGGELL